MNYTKILNIVTYVLFAITIVLLVLFLFGGEVPDQAFPTPIYTGSLLNWAYVLAVIATVSAIIFPILRLFTRPKQAMKSFLGLGVLVVLVLIAYAMSDGTPLKIIGYTGSDNVPTTLIWTDTLIYTMYLLFGAVVIAIVGTEIYKKVK